MNPGRYLIVAPLLAAGLLCALHRVRANSADAKGSIEVGGLNRTFALHLPAGYDGSKPVPLVLALHGRLGTGEGQAKLSHLDKVSDEHAFIVVYPDGVDRSWADGRGTSPAEKKSVNDVRFLSSLIDKLSQEYSIDTKRVYAIGMSNGGFMSGRLACELSPRIAAVAIVAASLSENLAATCHPKKPVSVMVIQGASDPLVPFTGGALGKNGDRGNVLSHATTIHKWTQIDKCTGEPAKGNIADGSGDGTSIDVRIFSHCDAGTEVRDYTVLNGGHTWPGGWPYLPEMLIGKTSKNMDASEAIWDFFSRHSR
jgi:polyhydroxybutyrate depolymerase